MKLGKPLFGPTDDLTSKMWMDDHVSEYLRELAEEEMKEDIARASKRNGDIVNEALKNISRTNRS